jgi:hypothetical protein
MDTGKSTLDSATRVAVTTMADNSGALPADALWHEELTPNKTLAIDTAARPRI